MQHTVRRDPERAHRRRPRSRCRVGHRRSRRSARFGAPGDSHPADVTITGTTFRGCRFSRSSISRAGPRPSGRQSWSMSTWPGCDVIFQQPFFPVSLDALPSRPTMVLVPPRETVIGGFRIHTQPLTHPGGAFAYRIQGDAGDVVYATDHEFGDRGGGRGARRVLQGRGGGHPRCAFHTRQSCARTRAAGHGSWKQCAEFAAASGARQLWLFHHRPGRTDEELAAIEARAREVFPRDDGGRRRRQFRGLNAAKSRRRCLPACWWVCWRRRLF